MSDIRILSVVTPAASQDLTLVATVKADLGIATGNDDAWLADEIHTQSEHIAGELNRVFGLETVTEIFTLARPRIGLNLRRYPNIAVASVVENGETLAAADYRLDSERGQIFRLSGGHIGCWPAGVDIAFSYDGGYALLDGLPRPLEKACRDLVKANWFARRRDPYVKSEDVPGVLRTDYWVGDLPGSVDMIMDRIAKYRDVVI